MAPSNEQREVKIHIRQERLVGSLPPSVFILIGAVRYFIFIRLLVFKLLRFKKSDQLRISASPLAIISSHSWDDQLRAVYHAR